MMKSTKIRNAKQQVSKEDLRQLLLAVLDSLADDLGTTKETPFSGENRKEKEDEGRIN